MGQGPLQGVGKVIGWSPGVWPLAPHKALQSLPGPVPGSQPSPHLLTRLSRRLATMEANRRSPASSEMRKTYSGAETWLDRWVRPGDKAALRVRPGGGGAETTLGAGPGSAGGGAGLTELLDGAVGAPGQLQGHVHTAPLVLDAAVSLEGDTRAGGLRDDGHELGGRKGPGRGWCKARPNAAAASSPSRPPLQVTRTSRGSERPARRGHHPSHGHSRPHLAHTHSQKCAGPQSPGTLGPLCASWVPRAAPSALRPHTFSPLMNRCFSLRFTWSMDRPCSARDSKATVPSGLDTTRPFLPVICGRDRDKTGRQCCGLAGVWPPVSQLPYVPQWSWAPSCGCGGEGALGEGEGDCWTQAMCVRPRPGIISQPAPRSEKVKLGREEAAEPGPGA